MKRDRLIITILLIALLILFSGCKKSESIDTSTPALEASIMPMMEPTTAPTVTPIITSSPSQEDLSKETHEIETLNPRPAFSTESTEDGSDIQPLEDLGNDDYKDVSYEICIPIQESMSEYRFIASGLASGTDIWSMGYVIGLEVYDENNTPLLSEDFSEYYDDTLTGYPVYNEMMDTMGLHVVDVNFDEYKDVIILNNFAGAHGNTWYDCWLWDVETSSFVASDSFAEICNPALDPVNKCIYSTGGSGAAYWGGRIYKFIDGEYVITNELDTDWGGLVETQLVNGQMEIVREVQYGDDDQMIRKEQEYYKNDELWQLDHPHWYLVGGHHADQWLE